MGQFGWATGILMSGQTSFWGVSGGGVSDEIII